MEPMNGPVYCAALNTELEHSVQIETLSSESSWFDFQREFNLANALRHSRRIPKKWEFPQRSHAGRKKGCSQRGELSPGKISNSSSNLSDKMKLKSR